MSINYLIIIVSTKHYNCTLLHLYLWRFVPYTHCVTKLPLRTPLILSSLTFNTCALFLTPVIWDNKYCTVYPVDTRIIS